MLQSDIDSQSIFAICQQTTPYMGHHIEGSVTLDLRNWSFLDIGQIVALAMMGKYFQSNGRSVDVIDNSAISGYLQRMDFFHYLGIPSQEKFQRHSGSGNFLELSEIDQSDNRTVLPSRLKEIVSSKSEVDPSLLSALEYSFGEIIDNVSTHSETPINGVVAAQFYPSKQFAEFCVGDLGVGIVSTLRNNPTYTALGDDEVLLVALVDGVGETTGTDFSKKGHGCGFGLAFAARLVEASGGQMWVVSRKQAAYFGKGIKKSCAGHFFPGTLICLRIPSNVRVLQSDVFRNGNDMPYLWTPTEGLIDDTECNDILW